MFLHLLPVELLDDIVQCVLQADLVSLSRTCSSIYPVAQRLLYRHLSVSFRNPGVILALAKKPTLAQYVRTFAVTLDPSSFFRPFYRHLANALSNITEVTSLELFVGPAASWVLSGTHRCVFPRLQRFACSFPLDSHVVDFLGKTESLLELEVDGISSPLSPMPSLPVASLPRLCEFKGSSHAATAIVPGRPVQSIYVNSGDLKVDDVATLARSTAHVAILGATTGSLPVPLLQSLTLHLPDLVYLRLIMMTTFNFSEAPDATFQNIANALTLLPNLRAFELSGMPWGSSLKAPEHEARIWQSQPLTNSPLDGDLQTDLVLA